ncbi:MAG TPA: hypothetical protein VK304_11110 [Thermoleophilaceae bacterium]|nr:hypothetical protein [Thermoleophilaceae bacterium]
MRKLIPLLALLTLLAVPASASAANEVVRSGDVKATLSYHCPDGTYSCREMRFRIARGSGKSNVVLDQRITLAGNRPFGPGRPGANSVYFANLDSDAEPEILVDLFTGGAHCCLVTFIYDFNGTSYNRIGRNWGDPGYVLTNIDRRDRPEFRSGDKRFAFLYTSFAETRFPIQIWNYRGGRLKTVTRKFRNTVRRDRDSHLRAYRAIRSAKGDVRGALAAYQADNYLLSRRTAARGWRILRRVVRQGKVNRPREGASGPYGRAYLRSLQRKLRQFHYAR